MAFSKNAAPPFVPAEKSAAPGSMSTMPMPPKAKAKKGKGKKKPPNHGKPTKGAFKADAPRDRSDKGGGAPY